MFISKKLFYLSFAIFAGIGLLAGLIISGSFGESARAENSCTVDEEILTELYESIFHRPIDANAQAHIGQDINTLLDSIQASEEHTQYTGLFKAMKALEEAKRLPGELAEEEEEQYKDIINSALSTVDSWADTLPEQAEEDAVIGPEQARNAIQNAYQNMNATAQQNAKFGLFNALEQIGSPSELSLPNFNPGNAAGAGSGN